MKRQKQPSGREEQVVSVWTLEQARKALPLVASIMRSLREDRLEAQTQQRRADRIAGRPGRPDRDTRIAHEEALRSAQEYAAKFDSGVQELLELNIYCLDPIRGLALIPFARGERLAWLVFELFAKDPLTTWRFHEDPLTTRRALKDIEDQAEQGSLIV
jgi:hypothetical protein